MLAEGSRCPCTATSWQATNAADGRTRWSGPLTSAAAASSTSCRALPRPGPSPTACTQPAAAAVLGAGGGGTVAVSCHEQASESPSSRSRFLPHEGPPGLAIGHKAPQQHSPPASRYCGSVSVRCQPGTQVGQSVVGQWLMECALERDEGRARGSFGWHPSW